MLLLFLLSEPRDYADETIHHIWSLYEMPVGGLTLEDGSAIEDHPNLVWLVKVEKIENKKLPDFLFTGV